MIRAIKIKQHFMNCSFKYLSKVTNNIKELSKWDHFQTNKDFENKERIEYYLHKLNKTFAKKGITDYELYKKILELVDHYKEIDSRNSLILLKYTGSSCVDLFPDERQKLLERIFLLFPKFGAVYNVFHYNAFMKITIENESKFDTDYIMNIFDKNNYEANSVTHEYILKQMCFTKSFPEAHKYLDSVLLKSKNDENMSPNLINGFIRGYFLERDEHMALSMFKKIVELNLRPNQETYYEIINGYLTINQNKKAYELFQSKNVSLSNQHLLKLYSKIVDLKKVYKNETVHEKEIINNMINNTISFLNRKYDNNFRVDCVNAIINLLKGNNTSESFHLVKTLFKNEYTEEDPEINDFYYQKLNVPQYFCNYLVKTDNSIEEILKYQNELDKHFSGNQLFHLKQITYYALENGKKDLSLKLISHLHDNNVTIKEHFFSSLILKSLKSISNRLHNKDKNNDIKTFEEWKDIKCIVDLMIDNYNLLNNPFETENLFGLFTRCQFLDINMEDNYLDLVNLIGTKRPLKTTSYVLAKLFLENCIRNLFYKTINTDVIHANIKFFYKLSETFTIQSDLLLGKYFLSYLTEMEKYNLLEKYIHNYSKLNDNYLLKYLTYQTQLFNTNNIELNESLKKLNEFILISFCSYLVKNEDVNETYVKNFIDIFIKNGAQFSFSTLKEINNLVDLGKSSIQLKYVLQQLSNSQTQNNEKDYYHGLHNKYISKFRIENKKLTEDSIQDLENYIFSNKNNNQNIYPYQRRLLNVLCNQDTCFKDEYVQRIKEIENQLPQTEFNLSVYASLMYFYSKHEIDYEKASFYYNKLLWALKSDRNFTVDPYKVISYVKILIKNNAKANDILNVINNFSYQKPLSYLKLYIEELFEEIYFKCDSSQIRLIANILYKNNYIAENVYVSQLIIQHIITNQHIDLAFETFKTYAKKDLIVCDIDLLRELLKSSNFNILKNNNILQLIRIISSSKGHLNAYECLFISLVQLNQFEKAELVLLNNLKGKFNTNQLESYINDCLRNKTIFKNNIELILLFKEFCNYSKTLNFNDKQVLNSLICNLML